MTIEREKQVAAEAAAELVENGMTVGLGTGSTVAYLLPALARRSLGIVCAAIEFFEPTWTPPTLSFPIPFEVDIVPQYLLLTFVVLIVLSIVAAIGPARGAAKTSIVDALGHV